jgi:hypothetical protein
MKFTALLGPLALAAGTVLANGASIVSSLSAIDNATLHLQSTVASWNGKLFTALPIVIESTSLLDAIKKGTKTAKDSAPLEPLEAIDVAGATITLAGSVNSTLTTLISAKPKFDKLKLSPLILINLSLQRKATGQMSEAIIAKVPAELQELAKNLVEPIDDAFGKGIEEFHPF